MTKNSVDILKEILDKNLGQLSIYDEIELSGTVHKWATLLEQAGYEIKEKVNG